MNKIITFAIYFCDILIPKKYDQIAFSSFPDVTDNSYAMFKYLYTNQRKTINKFIWLLSSMGKEEEYKQMLIDNLDLTPYDFQSIIFVKKNSINGLWCYFRSKYVFFTHGLYPKVRFSKKHVLINLWHGMPLKTIGLLNNPNKKDIPQSTYTIATSSFFQNYMSKAFGIDNDQVLITGQPRNDLLFQKSNFLQKLGISKEKYKKLFLWTPTYRKSIVGAIYSDGNVTNELPVIDKNIAELNTYLKKISSYMIIKLHPMDILNKNEFETYSNIIFLKNNDLEKIHCQLYSLLNEIDVLLTDFSSIYVDYLLLDRPIGFVMDDFDKYENSRGFVMDKPRNYMPGQFVSNKNMLFDFLQKSTDNIDEYKSQRNEVNQQLNEPKINFSECLWKEIIKRTL